MKTKFLFFALLLSSILIGCSSNEESTTSVNSDLDSYFPLTENNLWSYKKPDDNLIDKTNFSISGKVTLGGNTYFVVVSQMKDSLLLRKDNLGNVIEKSLSDGTERMLIPRKPVLDQYWFSKDSIDSICVTSVSSIINAYTDLVEVTTYKRHETEAKNFDSQQYFKKDVGCVKFNRKDWDYVYTLHSYELK